MQSRSRQKMQIEALWWVVTLLFTGLIMWPILQNVPRYPFIAENIFFVVAFITFTRYVFLLPSTPISHLKWIKLFIIASSAILFFVMVTGLSDFRNFVDDTGLQTLVTHLPVQKQTSIINYIKNEMVFFGVGSILAGIALPLRMVMSLWRMRNKGTI